jgi:hypothetical protein
MEGAWEWKTGTGLKLGPRLSGPLSLFLPIKLCRSKPDTTPGISRCHLPLFADTTENTENMILNDNKQDCIESIVRILERTAECRKTALARFDDPRNLKAAETLEQLAVDASGLTEEQWNALKPHYAWASQFWRDDLFQAARMVGFAHKSKNLDAFVRLLLRQMSSAAA